MKTNIRKQIKNIRNKELLTRIVWTLSNVDTLTRTSSSNCVIRRTLSKEMFGLQFVTILNNTVYLKGSKPTKATTKLMGLLDDLLVKKVLQVMTIGDESKWDTDLWTICQDRGIVRPLSRSLPISILDLLGRLHNLGSCPTLIFKCQ